MGADFLKPSINTLCVINLGQQVVKSVLLGHEEGCAERGETRRTQEQDNVPHRRRILHEGKCFQTCISTYVTIHHYSLELHIQIRIQLHIQLHIQLRIVHNYIHNYVRNIEKDIQLDIAAQRCRAQRREARGAQEQDDVPRRRRVLHEGKYIYIYIYLNINKNLYIYT